MTKKAPKPNIEALEAELTFRVRAGDLEGTVAFLLAQPETRRRSLSRLADMLAIQAYKRAEGETPEAAARRRLAANLAGWATAEPTGFRTGSAQTNTWLKDEVYARLLCEVLARRWPPDSPVRARIVEKIHLDPASWALSCRLEKEGLARRPRTTLARSASFRARMVTARPRPPSNAS